MLALILLKYSFSKSLSFASAYFCITFDFMSSNGINSLFVFSLIKNTISVFPEFNIGVNYLSGVFKNMLTTCGGKFLIFISSSFDCMLEFTISGLDKNLCNASSLVEV